MPKTETTLPDGTTITGMAPTGPGDFVPVDLNDELRRLGVTSPDFGDGDYVLNLTFRMSIPSWRAGWFLMAGIIKCAHGLGFEFQDGRFGTEDYVDFLAQKAGDPG